MSNLLRTNLLTFSPVFFFFFFFLDSFSITCCLLVSFFVVCLVLLMRYGKIQLYLSNCDIQIEKCTHKVNRIAHQLSILPTEQKKTNNNTTYTRPSISKTLSAKRWISFEFGRLMKPHCNFRVKENRNQFEISQILDESKK